jgi:hypothetical protein
MHTPFLYIPSIELLKRNLTGKERVVVKGASGWVGRTATLMLDALNIPTLLFASKARNEQIGEKHFWISEWDLNDALDFAPTHIIDAGYLTREFALEMDEKDYLFQNRLLTDQTLTLMDRVDKIKLIGFSSGVTQISNEQGKPYTLNKQRDELLFKDFALKKNKQISNFRIWSMAGGLVTKQRGFAFSEFILQALEGRISVLTNKMVYRRYCLTDEIISLAFTSFSQPYRLVDTGGQLIEIHDLAKKIQEIVNPHSIRICEKVISECEPDIYISDGGTWESLANSVRYNLSSIEDQIKLVRDSLVARNSICEN